MFGWSVMRTTWVLLAQTEREAREAWERLQGQFAALHLVVDQEKSRLNDRGRRFGFSALSSVRRLVGCCVCGHVRRACRNIRQRVREVARRFPSNGRVDVVIQS